MDENLTLYQVFGYRDDSPRATKLGQFKADSEAHAINTAKRFIDASYYDSYAAVEVPTS